MENKCKRHEMDPYIAYVLARYSLTFSESDVEFLRNQRKKEEEVTEESKEGKCAFLFFLIVLLLASFMPLCAYLYGKDSLKLFLAIMLPFTVGGFVLVFFYFNYFRKRLLKDIRDKSMKLQTNI